MNIRIGLTYLGYALTFSYSYYYNISPYSINHHFLCLKDWPNQKKLNALAQLIEQCEYNHIKHVHNLIDPKLKRDYISELPREVCRFYYINE